MKNLVNHHKFLKNSVNLCSSKQVGIRQTEAANFIERAEQGK